MSKTRPISDRIRFYEKAEQEPEPGMPIKCARGGGFTYCIFADDCGKCYHTLLPQLRRKRKSTRVS